ncbi:MAG: hypothetical protein GXP49_04460 [Deltaproteobacteria bacterium]|nr:hypothetical protein [Deltaproteobacteria bacterium]
MKKAEQFVFYLPDQACFAPPSPPFVPLSRRAGEGDCLVPMIPGALPQAILFRFRPFGAFGELILFDLNRGNAPGIVANSLNPYGTNPLPTDILIRLSRKNIRVLTRTKKYHYIFHNSCLYQKGMVVYLGN